MCVPKTETFSFVKLFEDIILNLSHARLTTRVKYNFRLIYSESVIGSTPLHLVLTLPLAAQPGSILKSLFVNNLTRPSYTHNQHVSAQCCRALGEVYQNPLIQDRVIRHHSQVQRFCSLTLLSLVTSHSLQKY